MMDSISMLLYADPDAPTRRISLLSSGEWQQRGSSGGGKRRHQATLAQTGQSRIRLTKAYFWHYTISSGTSCSDFARRRSGVRIPSAPLVEYPDLQVKLK